MDQDRVHEVFEEELTSWSATSVLVFDNVRDKGVPPAGESWCRFTINWMNAENRSLGANITRNGIATLQIFTPRNVGPRVAAKIADAYFDLLQNRVIGGGIFIYAGTATRLGDGQDWYQLNADLSFQAT